MKSLLSAVLLLAACTEAGAPSRTAGRESGAYTPTAQVARPLGGLSTSCRFDPNGLGASCRPLDREPEGPITPISAGQAR